VTYSEAIQFLYGLQLFGTHFGLERTRQLAALAGSPQEKLRFIHVAGTNGKGSTCAMLESIYRAAGLRVGLFTSPHLVSFRERMQVDRQLVSEADVARLVAEIQPLLRQFPAEAHPTMFEVVAVMALKYFAEQQCELVVWETGLGGRLDATNIVTPLASVITNIALDHQQWLGETLGKIAAEKAGIIKPGVPVITATDAPEALAVIKQAARENHASLTIIASGEVEERLAGTPAPPLSGEHQKLNAALALATVEMLQKQIPVGAEKIREGMAAVSWPGRLQVIQRDAQKILLDGAHNLAGAEALRAALERAFPGTRPLLIFGALADKNWPDICRVLAPLSSKIFTVPVASKRTADPRAVEQMCRNANPQCGVSAFENLTTALNASQDERFVLITGSLYLIGEALELLGGSPGNARERGLNEWSAPENPR
jgi:dihydrofolate synthase/folylpolyglutamate synthase